jgi:hypothetical protein
MACNFDPLKPDNDLAFRRVVQSRQPAIARLNFTTVIVASGSLGF